MRGVKLLSILLLSFVAQSVQADSLESLRITIDGEDSTKGLLQEVVVDQSQSGPDRVEVTLDLEGLEQTALDPRPGQELEVGSVGRDGRTTTVFSGEIVGVEAIYRADERPLFVLRGYDKLHRATRERTTRTWLDVKDSDIAREIAATHGLDAAVEDSGFRSAYVIQNNETDLSFLYERARRIGFEVDVHDNTLVFRRRRLSGEAEAYIGLPETWETRRYATTDTGAPIHLLVSGAHPERGEELLAEVSSVGDDRTARSLGEYEKIVVVDPVFSQEEIDAIAKAALVDRVLALTVAQGTTAGSLALRPGALVEAEAESRRFSGKYYVSRAIHRLVSRAGPGNGYTTEFEIRRTGH